MIVSETDMQGSEIDNTPPKAKDREYCYRCGVELTIKELISGAICVVCWRNQKDKDNEKRRREG